MRHVNYFLLLFSGILLLNFSLLAKPDDFAIIKERVTQELLTSQVHDSHIESVMNMMQEDGSFEGINYEDLSRTAGFPHRRHTGFLVDMAKAYKTKSSKYHNNKKVLQSI